MNVSDDLSEPFSHFHRQKKTKNADQRNSEPIGAFSTYKNCINLVKTPDLISKKPKYIRNITSWNEFLRQQFHTESGSAKDDEDDHIQWEIPET